MKIGILTFHRAENFGAVMQCYALQKYIESLGYQVLVIDYRCKVIEQVYHVFNPSIIFNGNNKLQQLRAYLGRIKAFKPRLRKKHLYDNFRKSFLNLTEPIKTISELNCFDAVVVGSDQVWNSALTSGFDSMYFLDGQLKGRKIAYAVSTEGYSYRYYAQNSEKLKKLVEGFNIVSVREESFKQELSKYIQRELEVCIDPIFLLDSKYYETLITQPSETGYVLVYHLVDSLPMSNMAKEIGEQVNKKVIELHAGFGKNVDSERVMHKHNIGPTELLGYIAYADMVLTTSFHGLAFSILFHKPFWAIDNGSTARQRNLLTQLDLDRRIIAEDEYVIYSECIDYQMVDKKKEVLVSKSKQFIRQALS